MTQSSQHQTPPAPRRALRWFAADTAQALTSGLALAWLVGCGAVASAAPAEEAASIDVQTSVATARSVPRTLSLTGSLTARREARIAADGAGKITATFVERGDRVKRGDPLARVDARSQAFASVEAQAQTEALRAQEQTAKLECQRAQSLFAGNAISRAEYDRTNTSCAVSGHSVAAARARALLAAKAVGDSIIRAPFDGVVAERSIDVGNYVVAGHAIATLVDVDTLRLELSVPESALAAVGAGDSVEFAVAAYPGRRFSGRLSHLGPVVRTASRDQIVEAVVDNSDGLLRPGMFAVAELTVGTDPLPVVPETALRGSRESGRLFVVDEDRIEERVVLARQTLAGEIAIVKGLRAGERVVNPITEAVRDGARVR
ncbi:MAG: efflux RND transporter periplasmic adaptor subunit [Deltaproteobacteria bacterium]